MIMNARTHIDETLHCIGLYSRARSEPQTWPQSEGATVVLD